MTTIYCLINIDDINYKLTMVLDNDRILGTEEDLRLALRLDTEPDFEKYDFSLPHFIFEIYDKSMSEYVSIDHETEIENFSKIRVKILDPEQLIPAELPKTSKEDTELSFLELSDWKDDCELVEIYAQSHVPDDEIIQMIDNANITPESFSIHNIKIKKQLIKSVIKYQGLFNVPGTPHDGIWENICTDIKDNMGARVLSLIRCRRKELGFVTIIPQFVQRELISLIGQYNRLLRLCKPLTAQLAERLWPLFKTFHKSLRIEFIYPEKGPSLKIMQKDFDNARKFQ